MKTSLRYFGKLRVRKYHDTSARNKASLYVGIMFWHSLKDSRRRWTLDINLGRVMIAIWLGEEWIWSNKQGHD